MFCKCYRLFESLIQLLPAMVCKHLLSCFLSSTAHVNTPTLKHYKHKFPVSLWNLSPPFPGLLPMITEVTFSKVFFIMQRKVLEIGMVSAVFNSQTVQNVIVKPLSQNYASKNGILESCPCKYIHPLCNKAHTICQWDLMFKWINQLCLSICILKYLSIYSKDQMFWGAIFKSGYGFLSLS